MLGVDVDWDAATWTVHIGGQPQVQPTPIPTPPVITQPRVSTPLSSTFYDSGGGTIIDLHTIQPQDSVAMGGTTYRNAVVFSQRHLDRPMEMFSLHNLNRQYRSLTGYIGRVDGSVMSNATFRIYGDGRLLETYNVNAQDLPKAISVFVEDIRQLRIVAMFSSSGAVTYAVVGTLE